jgi:preprotein translocase subunit SecE
VARRRDEDLREGEGDDEEPSLPSLEPEAPPGRISSSDVSAPAPAPRAARFGEGPEGRAARRERGVAGHRAGFFERVGQFWRDIRAELKRVSWPTPKEVQSTTIITIIAVAFFAAYLWVVDKAFTELIEGVTGLLGG